MEVLPASALSISYKIILDNKGADYFSFVRRQWKIPELNAESGAKRGTGV